jgi:hypothetical protein
MRQVPRTIITNSRVTQHSCPYLQAFNLTFSQGHRQSPGLIHAWHKFFFKLKLNPICQENFP